jgi:ParB-like nuclease domain
MKTVWVALSDIKSEQMSLRRDRLLYQLRHYAEMQRKRRPTVVMARGTYTVWDGNHRISAGVLLGKKRMRCTLLYDPAECARTVEYIKRGGRK